MTQVVNIFSKLEQWIRVHTPKIEDGNNFGVSVQREVLEEISGLSVSMKKSLNGIPSYFEIRASAWEKIASKASKETKTCTSATEEKGGKVRSCGGIVVCDFIVAPCHRLGFDDQRIIN